ncbi:MAG: hypothetical protein ACRD38_02025 [Nitrososphaerales archaeon]
MEIELDLNNLERVIRPDVVFRVVHKECNCTSDYFWPVYFGIDKCNQLHSEGILAGALYHGLCPMCSRPYTILHIVNDQITLATV